MRISNLLSCTSAPLALLLISGGAFCAAAESKPAADKTPDHRHSVDLRPILQKWRLDARSQGGRGTCSVFAMNAALEYAVATKRQRGTRLSVEFLNWASNEAVGAAIDGGCFSELWTGYAAHGVCPEADMPYADSFDPARKPDKKALADAAKIHALGLQLHWIKNWDPTRGASDEQLAEIKQTLKRRWPVCGGFLWPKTRGPLVEEGRFANVPAKGRHGRPQRFAGGLSQRRDATGRRGLSHSQLRRPKPRRHDDLRLRPGVPERRRLARLPRRNTRRPAPALAQTAVVGSLRPCFCRLQPAADAPMP